MIQQTPRLPRGTNHNQQYRLSTRMNQPRMKSDIQTDTQSYQQGLRRSQRQVNQSSKPTYTMVERIDRPTSRARIPAWNKRWSWNSTLPNTRSRERAICITTRPRQPPHLQESQAIHMHIRHGKEQNSIPESIHIHVSTHMVR